MSGRLMLHHSLEVVIGCIRVLLHVSHLLKQGE